MNKILVCAEDALSIIRIDRLLTAKNMAFDCVKSPVKTDDLFRYSLVIIHSSWRLANVYQFIERAVLSKTVPVIYVTPTINIAPFSKIMNNPYFSLIEEGKIDMELSIACVLMRKFAMEMKVLVDENNAIKNRSALKQTMEDCKKRLIESGMSEDAAHRTILKRAMDDQISKFDACSRILKEIIKKDIE